MSSNIKPKTPVKEAPTEPFKRAVSVCLKAIAGKGDLEVSFAAERPGLAGGKARLPEPPRRLNEREAAIVRGHADSIALRLACHDPAVHRKLVPGGPQARAVFGELARLLGEQPYFAGDAVSLADFLIAPQIGFFTQTPEWSVLGAPHANLVAWLARMEARPSLQATTWERVSEMAKAA